MKSIIALVIAIYGAYTFVPEAHAAIGAAFDRCPLAVLLDGRVFGPTISPGDRNGLNPR